MPTAYLAVTAMTEEVHASRSAVAANCTRKVQTPFIVGV